MASIIKRKNKFSVVYSYTDAKGNKKQKWETFSTNGEAKKRKAEVEHQQATETFVVPTTTTVSELLEEYMNLYGVNKWAMSTYEARQGLISHYINPIIGDMSLKDITPRIMDKFYHDLLSVRMVSSKFNRPRSEFLTAHTVREIHKTLRNAFNQAVKWELMGRNPVENATLPKEEHEKREIWTADVLFRAIELCEDDDLKLALNLSFSCSLRMGEMLGLTWDCVDISEESIENGKACIFVNKELQRVNKDVQQKLNDKDVLFRFPCLQGASSTALVLKTPKTKTSIRKIFLPKTVAEMLISHKKAQDELKALLGSDYSDYGLVFTTGNGRPMEGTTVNSRLGNLIRENNLPKVVFHSIRHSSITYKLKLNGGDMKSVQGDSGHAQLKMVADVYSHIIDDDRCLNAQRFEEEFYGGKAEKGNSGKKEKMSVVMPEKEESEPEEAAIMDAETLELLKLLKKPGVAEVLKAMTKAM